MGRPLYVFSLSEAPSTGGAERRTNIDHHYAQTDLQTT
jgi:hypothetical protein